MCSTKSHGDKVLAVTLLGLFLFSRSCQADIPKSVQSALQSHENQFTQTTFLWNVVTTKVQPNPDPAEVAHDQKSVAMQARVRARQLGMRDESNIQKFVQQETTLVKNAEAGYSFRFADVTRFANHNDVTEVIGHNQFTLSDLRSYYERYGNKQGLIARIDLSRPTTTAIAYVWASSGNTTQFFSPFQNSLNLRPEDFVLFAEKNPLKIYTGQWKVVTQTSDVLVLETDQTQGAFTPFRLLMTLDPKHGYLPSHIKAKGKTWATEYVVQSYQKDSRGWLPDHVTINEHWFDLQIHRQMALIALKASVPVLSNLPKLTVVDYRLIGDNPYTAQIDAAIKSQSPNVMIYTWSGSIPSLGKLKMLRQQQHPGEASPDLGQSGSGISGPLASVSNTISSAMPFAGGVLCLVGGVWMFKQRKVN